MDYWRTTGRWRGGLHPRLADLDGGFEDQADGNDTEQFVRRHGRQAHGGNAPARTTVRVASELARNNFCFQVSRQCLSGECEDTFFRVWRRCDELPDQAFWHVQ